VAISRSGQSMVYLSAGLMISYNLPPSAWRTKTREPGDPLPKVQYPMRPTTRPAARVVPRYETPRASDVRASDVPLRVRPAVVPEPPEALVPGATRRPAVTLEHRTNRAALESLDPERFGTGLAGAERARARDFRDDFVKRSYTTRAGGAIDDRFQQMAVHHGQVMADRLCGIGRDPWGFRARAESQATGDPRRIATFAERYAKEAGFAGYYDSRAERPSDRDTVVLFERSSVAPRGSGTKPSPR